MTRWRSERWDERVRQRSLYFTLFIVTALVSLSLKKIPCILFYLPLVIVLVLFHSSQLSRDKSNTWMSQSDSMSVVSVKREGDLFRNTNKDKPWKEGPSFRLKWSSPVRTQLSNHCNNNGLGFVWKREGIRGGILMRLSSCLPSVVMMMILMMIHDSQRSIED